MPGVRWPDFQNLARALKPKTSVFIFATNILYFGCLSSEGQTYRFASALTPNVSLLNYFAQLFNFECLGSIDPNFQDLATALKLIGFPLKSLTKTMYLGCLGSIEPDVQDLAPALKPITSLLNPWLKPSILGFSDPRARFPGFGWGSSTNFECLCSLRQLSGFH